MSLRTLHFSVVFAFLVLSSAFKVEASLYLIDFNDGAGDSGSGEIDVESASGIFHAASGYLNVTAGQAIGNWSLYVAGGSAQYPNYMTSPAGAYWYNNAFYPSGNPQYPAVNPVLDQYGLLFTQDNGYELNLWGNADGSYTLGGNIGGWQNFNVTISFDNINIDPVPEASTSIAGLFLLIPITAGALRTLLRRNRAA